MVYHKNFNETVRDLSAFKALPDRFNANSKNSYTTVKSNPSNPGNPGADKKEEIGLKNIAIVGKEWQQTVAEAPYECTRLNADRMWKMPGSRVTIQDNIQGICKKYWLVYHNFLKLAICAVGAFLCFFVMGGIFTYAGIALVIGMGCYYQAYKQHLETAYSLESNWAALLPIGAERSYMVDSEWSGTKRSKK